MGHLESEDGHSGTTPPGVEIRPQGLQGLACVIVLAWPVQSQALKGEKKKGTRL